MARKQQWLEVEGAFAALYADNARDLTVFFTRRVFDTQVAVDLTAESFAQAFLSRRRFRGTGADEARAWLFGIARHQLSRFLRKGAAERRAIRRLGVSVPALSEDEHRRVEELAGMDSLREHISHALDGLPVGHRAALQLRVVDELSYAEVAKSLGISEQAARARVSRGLRGLAKALEGADHRVEEFA